MRYTFADEVDDVLRGRAGEENFSDTGFLEGGNVCFGDDAADEDGDIGHAFVAEEIHELRADGVVGAREDGEADDVDVFLDGGRGDHFGGLTQARVDDFHAGVAEGVQAARNFFFRARGAEFAEAPGLAMRYGFVDLQSIQRLFFGGESIYA